MFDGLRLSVAPPNAAPVRTPLDRAVERYARAAGDILTARREGGTELPHQRAAFEKAGKALDVIEPNAARDMRSAFNRDNSLIDAAAKGWTVNAMQIGQASSRDSGRLRGNVGGGRTIKKKKK